VEETVRLKLISLKGDTISVSALILEVLYLLCNILSFCYKPGTEQEHHSFFKFGVVVNQIYSEFGSSLSHFRNLGAVFWSDTTLSADFIKGDKAHSFLVIGVFQSS
jgi:hypothetical protein